MRLVKSFLLAGAAVAGLAILAPTVARELNPHRIAHPSGWAAETSEYSGVPRLIVHQTPVSPWPPLLSWRLGFAEPSFAALDRVMAEMNRQMAVMMHQADLMTRLSTAPLSQAVLRDLPPGTTSFSLVQTSSGNGICTRVTRITRGAGDAKPQMVSESSGCGDRLEAKPANPDLKQANYQPPAVGPGTPL
jgi:hypothetical protein